MKAMVNQLLRAASILVVLITVSGCVSDGIEPSASKEPSADIEPSADREPSASKEPSANVEPSATKQPSSDPRKIDKSDQAKAEAAANLRLLRERETALRVEREAAKIEEEQARKEAIAIDKLCRAIGNKLGSVSVEDCTQEPLIHSGYSTKGYSIAYREYLPLTDRKPLGKVLVLGGIHGDEFSSVSIMFKWMRKLDQFHSGLFHWRIVPTVNPDGLLQRKSQRQNSNGVDLNRNFPTSDWDENAHDYWVSETGKHPRRNPGPYAASELETQWVMNQIKEFEPDVIISMHAPYHLVDYDGPPHAPESLGSLYLRKLGVYPGSLGNYVGVDMKKPIVTVELKSAGIMPRTAEIDSMWSDLVRWLRGQLADEELASSSSE